jgi:hypothetical protein
MPRQKGPDEITWTAPQTRLVLDALAAKIRALPADAAIAQTVGDIYGYLRLMHLDASQADEWTLTVARKSKTYDQGRTDRERELADMHPNDRKRIFDAYDAAKRASATTKEWWTE